MGHYRKKPVVIEAIQWTGDMLDAEKVMEFFEGAEAMPGFQGNAIHIYTLEGIMTASPDDWIIKGVKGEFYPCKPDIFEATYEAVE
jgi:hypothetical protein